MSEPQYGGVQLLVIRQGLVHDWIFDEMLGWDLDTMFLFNFNWDGGGMFISFVYFYYRSLVNVPCKICRRESQVRATIEVQTLSDGVP